VVPAGHGAQVENEPVVPFAVPVQGRYSPALGSRCLAYAVPYTDTASRALAARALAVDPRDALADMTRLTDGRDDWILRRDLLSSDRFAPDYVAEPDDDGTVHLRFGDDVSGRPPWRDSSSPRRTGPAAAAPKGPAQLGTRRLCRVLVDATWSGRAAPSTA
jgi:hypothetical protein